MITTDKIYSFSYQIFAECSVSARHVARHWGAMMSLNIENGL